MDFVQIDTLLKKANLIGLRKYKSTYFIGFHSLTNVWLYRNTDWEPTVIMDGTIEEVIEYLRTIIKYRKEVY